MCRWMADYFPTIICLQSLVDDLRTFDIMYIYASVHRLMTGGLFPCRVFEHTLQHNPLIKHLYYSPHKRSLIISNTTPDHASPPIPLIPSSSSTSPLVAWAALWLTNLQAFHLCASVSLVSSFPPLCPSTNRMTDPNVSYGCGAQDSWRLTLLIDCQ